MKLIIDDAHIDQIKKIYEYYPVDGVTTNPTILAKSGRQPYEVLKEIREFIGAEAELHVQVVAQKAAGMVEDAHRIVEELDEAHLRSCLKTLMSNCGCPDFKKAYEDQMERAKAVKDKK